jgi:hypothetical protein
VGCSVCWRLWRLSSVFHCGSFLANDYHPVDEKLKRGVEKVASRNATRKSQDRVLTRPLSVGVAHRAFRLFVPQGTISQDEVILRSRKDDMCNASILYHIY